MLPVSRILPLTRRLISKPTIVSKAFQPKRNGGGLSWYYRDNTSGSNQRFKVHAEVMMTAMWYWIFWHLWYDFDHLTGHYPYPKPEKWTDEELGIPPDDED